MTSRNKDRGRIRTSETRMLVVADTFNLFFEKITEKYLCENDKNK